MSLLLKQLSFSIPISDWRAIRDEALKRSKKAGETVSMKKVCLKMMEDGGMQKVRNDNPDQIGKV